MLEASILKILIPASFAFMSGIVITPFITHFLYKHKIWKKTGGKQAMGGHEAVEFNRLKGAAETQTPRMGGMVIWGSVFITVGVLYCAQLLWPTPLLTELDFLSRSQTLIPLTTLLLGALIGLINDWFDVTRGGEGMRLRMRLLLITGMALVIGWWFYDKLEVTTVGIPFAPDLYLGILIIPFFIVLINLIYASGIIDGIDGLSGGVFSSVYIAYAGVAMVQQQFDIAALCATIAGATLAFLWFNIPPARFWMTETGSMALTLTLAVVVMLTDSLGEGHGVFLFLIIGLPLLATVASAVVQILYRKATGKKLLRIAPLHHHFEAIGWPPYKVTMRYWVISIICAVLGIIVAALV